MIRLIAAVDWKRGIAKNGLPPWSLPSDMLNFVEKTKSNGGIVLVGQKTYETFLHAGPLEGRRTYVLSHEAKTGDGVIYIQDLDEFFNQQAEDVWVIGGESLFRQTIIVADELYLTQIEADFGCDQFFPEYEHVFELKESSDLHTENGFIFRYNTYGKL
ncbi:MAG: dihydrofolate reductase family protein [Candidatus Saccharibacteria bacterium]|nr:dihydrofolate reductase family protein [Candidatus Saccharibacteria bacterium]